MAAKKSYLCWDDIDNLDSRALAEWGAFRSPHVETVELEGCHTKSATFAMCGSGFSFELTYFWEDEPAGTVRQRIQLYRSPRRASRDRQVMRGSVPVPDLRGPPQALGAAEGRRGLRQVPRHQVGFRAGVQDCAAGAADRRDCRRTGAAGLVRSTASEAQGHARCALSPPR
jgi:hypothetical protein